MARITPDCAPCRWTKTSWITIRQRGVQALGWLPPMVFGPRKLQIARGSIGTLTVRPLRLLCVPTAFAANPTRWPESTRIAMR